MCGLFGVAALSTAGIDEEVREYLNILGTMSNLRGGDSTGVTTISGKAKKYTVKTYKNEGPYSDFLAKHRVLYDTPDLRVVIGHCRKATKGDMSHTNIHPIITGSLIGTHNGTIHGIDCTKEKLSDSRVLFERINKTGLQATVKGLKGIGAWALAYYDKSDGTINLTRNLQRNLYYMFNKSETMVMWASELIFLQFVKTRAKHTCFSDPKLVTDHQCVKIPISTFKVEKSELEKYKYEYKGVSVPSAGKLYTPQRVAAERTYKRICSPPSGSHSYSYANDSYSYLEDEPAYEPEAHIGYNGEIWAWSELSEFLDHNLCGYCGNSLGTVNFRDEIWWYDKMTPIGTCCSSNTEEMEAMNIQKGQWICDTASEV